MAHNIEALRTRFMEMLTTLDVSGNLSELICAGYSAPDIDECLEWDVNGGTYWARSGATKVVIGDEDCDYVIKFQPEKLNFDYCGYEAKVCAEAEKRGYGKHFAWTAYLFDYDFYYDGEVKTIAIYVSECCDCDAYEVEARTSKHSYVSFCDVNGYIIDSDEAREAWDASDSCECDDEAIVSWACEEWGVDYDGEDTVITFLRDMKVNDLHCGNWGWCGGELVLVDYSGFGLLEHRGVRY